MVPAWHPSPFHGATGSPCTPPTPPPQAPCYCACVIPSWKLQGSAAKPETSPVLGFLLGSAGWLLLEYLPLKSNPPHRGAGFLLSQAHQKPYEPHTCREGCSGPRAVPVRIARLPPAPPAGLQHGWFQTSLWPHAGRAIFPMKEMLLAGAEGLGFFFWFSFCFLTGCKKGFSIWSFMSSQTTGCQNYALLRKGSIRQHAWLYSKCISKKK